MASDKGKRKQGLRFLWVLYYIQLSLYYFALKLIYTVYTVSLLFCGDLANNFYLSIIKLANIRPCQCKSADFFSRCRAVFITVLINVCIYIYVVLDGSHEAQRAV